MYIYIYTYIHIYTCKYIFIHIYTYNELRSRTSVSCAHEFTAKGFNLAPLSTFVRPDTQLYKYTKNLIVVRGPGQDTHTAS